MYCTFCGSQIANDDALCPNCGKPVEQDAMLAKLAAAARMGDRDAVSALYEKTYSKVYYTVKSMIKDEDAVLDIVQDTYIKAFAHLDSFGGDMKFLPWIRKIASNTARDWLKKKRPMLFAELRSGDGQDAPVEELLPDERGESLPDQIIDQAETKRLIREIIEELPEDQRAAIGMFYYEEMSVKEIADAMGVSESAVKSRLMYGRSKIEKKVRELEKQGTKLYSLAPIPFLMLLFRNQKVYAAEVPDSRILHAILDSKPMGAAATGTAESAGAAGTAAAGTAAAVGGLSALKIGLIALAAVSAAGLGVFGVTRIASHSAEPQELAVIEDVINQTEPREPSTVKDDIDRTESEETKETEKTEETEEVNPIDEALEQYRIIIGQADSYEYDESIPDLETMAYRYALVQMQSDDPVPTLLLQKEEKGWAFVLNTRIFQYDPDTKTVHKPTESIPGGSLGGLSMAGDGHGMFDQEWSGGTGIGSITRITLDGDSLNRDTFWNGRIDLKPETITGIKIEWHDIGDLSALDNWTAPDPDETESSDPVDSDTLPTDGDRVVLTGTVGTYDYDEIIALQGQPDPNGFDEAAVESSRSVTYHVIVLDTPQTLRLYSGEDDNYYIHEASMINLYYADDMEQYDGQHITFSIDPDNTHWPSDTSLPLGQPFTRDINILD